MSLGAEVSAGSAALAAPPRRLGFFKGIAGRLLALTLGFVLVGEVLIFVPTLAGFYMGWLRDRVNAAQIAALAAESNPGGLNPALERELLANAEVHSVALIRKEKRVLVLSQGNFVVPGPIENIDLRTITLGTAISESIETLLGIDAAALRVTATPRFGSGERIQIIVSDRALMHEMRAYARDVISVSLFLSLLTASFVYAALIVAVARPIRSLTERIERFRANPTADLGAPLVTGEGEIASAESALAAMEEQVRASLRQRQRLAALGGAVARIAYDLRAGLATAQLLTERLAASADPKVRQIAPRLEKAIERAGGLAQAALRFGKAEEAPPTLTAVIVADALGEAAAEVLAAFPEIVWRGPDGAAVAALADADQLHRIFANLVRNAAQALAAQADRQTPGVIAATITNLGAHVLVRIVDDGPGLPERVQARLFEPFSGSSNGAGAGLGLAIARELARAQGGDVALVATGAEGTAFEVRLPSAPVQ